MVTLSVLLITWNSEKYIDNCILSVLKSTEAIDKEILVVDNGSTDGTREKLQQYASAYGIRSILLDKNQGVSKARNRALREAKGAYLWLLDIDTEVNKKVVETMLRYMKEHTICGCCGCKLKHPEGEVQESCRRFPSMKHKSLNVMLSLLQKSDRLESLKRFIQRMNEAQFYHEKMKGQEPFEVEYLIGACQFIRKEVVEQVGFLDEKIFYGPEDADYCLRIAKSGWNVVYLPQVSCVHAYCRITSKHLLSRMSWIHFKALLYFFWKHKRI